MKLGLFYDYHEGLAFEVELGVTVEPPRWGRLGGTAQVGPPKCESKSLSGFKHFSCVAVVISIHGSCRLFR